MEVASNFKKRFGEKKLGQLLGYAGKHALEFGNDKPLEDDDNKLIYALLEALGFECYTDRYGCVPLSEEEIKTFMVDNCGEFASYSGPIPDHLALFCGVYNFLNEAEVEDNG